MNKSELEKLFLEKKEEMFSKHDSPGKALEELGETLPVILFRFDIITGYVGPGSNTFCEEGTFFSGDGLSDLGRGILERGLSDGISLAEDDTEKGCVRALLTLADRYYKKAELLALKIESDQEKEGLYRVAEMMRHLSNEAPQNFLERLELVWMLQMGEVLMDTGKVMSTDVVEEVLKTSAAEEPGLPEDVGRLIDSFFSKWKFVFGKRV